MATTPRGWHSADDHSATPTTTETMSPAQLRMSEARSTLEALGMTIRRKDGEYRVNVRGGSESTAYYTNDIADAVQTGTLMARKQLHGQNFRDALDVLRVAQARALSVLLVDAGELQTWQLDTMHALSVRIVARTVSATIEPLADLIAAAQDVVNELCDDSAATHAAQRVVTLARAAQSHALAAIANGER